MNNKNRERKSPKREVRFVNQAWIRNGDGIVTGEALILATLMHTHGADRAGNDFKVVQKLMKDINLDEGES